VDIRAVTYQDISISLTQASLSSGMRSLSGFLFMSATVIS